MIGNAVRYLFVMVAISLFLSTGALAGDAVVEPDGIAGSYVVSGWNPGSDTAAPPQYEGSVELTAWGEAWKYTGFMDDTPYVGVGVYDEATGILSLSFHSEDGSEAGAIMLKTIKGGLSGRWVFAGVGNGVLGTETWTRKP